MTEVNGIELGFDPDLVKAELEKMEWLESWQDDDQEVRSMGLGTVFSLTPSGKYYTPFACSNVEPCDVCGGAGVFGAALCTVCRGKGDRAVESLAYLRGETVEETIAFLRGSGVKLTEDSFECFACGGTGFFDKVCENCGGLGSREVYLDSLWRGACETLHDSHSFSIENGEGDPCDIFAVQYRDKED